MKGKKRGNEKKKKKETERKKRQKTQMDLCVVRGVMRKSYWEQFYKTYRKQKLFSPIKHAISLK